MDTIEAINSRRSVRRYKTDPVDDATLQKVLEAARWAPSWANSQCPHIIVVRDPAVRQKISEVAGKTPAHGAITEAGVLLVHCAKKGVSGYYNGKESTDKGDWFFYDVGLAAQNVALAAHALGLGTVNVGIFDAKKAAEILKLPEDYCVVTLMPLGYPDQDPKAPPRLELTETVSYDYFGGKA